MDGSCVAANPLIGSGFGYGAELARAAVDDAADIADDDLADEDIAVDDVAVPMISTSTPASAPRSRLMSCSLA
jgi:hypothetical protein